MANTRGSFGDLLRHYRTLAGMSQEALAGAIAICELIMLTLVICYATGIGPIST